MVELFRQGLTRLGVFMSHPAAFLIVSLYAAAWIFLNAAPFDWHSGATLVTLFMTLFIQRAEHRDTQAIHAKLDELLRAASHARNELTHLDAEEPETIEEHRAEEQDRDSNDDGMRSSG
jgi:low affinity Fe/Cu permease